MTATPPAPQLDPADRRATRELSTSALLAEAEALMAAMDARRYDWSAIARPEQMEPADYAVWLLLAGRGFGKTRTGAETTRRRATIRPNQEIAVIGKTHRETQRICFEHRTSGLLACIPPAQVKRYRASEGSVSLTLTNGSTMYAFSAEDPDALRGYAFDFVWGDEMAAWPGTSAQAVYDMAWFCLREARRPGMVISTTPQPLPHIRKLVNRAHRDPRVVMTTGSTFDNAANLSAVALEELEKQYGGTRLGRQELSGELLGDVEDAFAAMSDIDAARVAVGDLPGMALTLTAVDPATTDKLSSDETGIITVGIDSASEGYVIDDASGHYSPDGWARQVWAQVARHGSQLVVVEDNAGGDMCEFVLKQTWAAMQREMRARASTLGAHVPIQRVHPSGAGQGKWARALPIATLIEQHRIHFVTDPEYTREVLVDGRAESQPRLQGLEDQASTWKGERGEISPDRVDAMVHGLTWALFPGRRTQQGKRAVSAPTSHRWSRTSRR